MFFVLQKILFYVIIDYVMMKKMKEHLGQLLKRLRKEHNLTQGELALGLAKRLNKYVHPNYISRWEGMAYPPTEVISNLCDYYGITLKDIFNQLNGNGHEEEVEKTFSPEVQELCQQLDDLSPDAKAILISLVKNMLEKNK